MTIRHFLNLADAGPEGVTAILQDAQARKAARETLDEVRQAMNLDYR